MSRVQAADISAKDPVKLAKREVPWRYTFLNPLTVDLLAENVSQFLGNDSKMFAISIPEKLSQKLRNKKTDLEKKLFAKLPADIQKIIMSGGNSILLNPEKTVVFYYKKDDWCAWARPMVYSILPDLIMLEKLKLADAAALDGAMSCIRVWKLGNLDSLQP